MGHIVSKSMRYHGASIENTYCYRFPLAVTQTIRNIQSAYDLSHRSKPLLTFAQAQYSLKVKRLHSIATW